MAKGGAEAGLDEAFEQIERSILPSLTLVLDTLIEAAGLARPAQDADTYAHELRSLAIQLEALTRQVEATSPARVDAADYRAASAA